jgi:hypothetical protein
MNAMVAFQDYVDRFSGRLLPRAWSSEFRVNGRAMTDAELITHKRLRLIGRLDCLKKSQQSNNLLLEDTIRMIQF